MSSKKEEERNEKIIRGLMKLPPNRKCINCNSLGPQYVCTNFWTFICITCSGIHREFTHRVKSVSMAKFLSQEVDALQRGGNQRAREMFLKDWDMQRQRLPDSSNLDKIREFIKNVYVERKYAGGKSIDKPPRDTQNYKNHEEDHRRASSYHSFSQSPPYDYQYEDRRYGKQAGALNRKPGSDRGLYEGKISSFVYSPGRLADHIYEERFSREGSRTRVSDYSVSCTSDQFAYGSQSPNFHKGSGFASSPSSDILVEDMHTLAKSDVGASAHLQRTVSSGSFGSLESNSISVASATSNSLFDVGLEPEKSSGALQQGASFAPFLPPSSGSVPAANLDLFNPPFVKLQETSSSSIVDFFGQMTHNSTACLEQNKSVAPSGANEGWATFDSPQQAATANITHETLPIVYPGNAFVEKLDALPSVDNSMQQSSAKNSTDLGSVSLMTHLWHGNSHNIVAHNDAAVSQPWNAFDDSNRGLAKDPFETLFQANVILVPAERPTTSSDDQCKNYVEPWNAFGGPAGNFAEAFENSLQKNETRIPTPMLPTPTDHQDNNIPEDHGDATIQRYPAPPHFQDVVTGPLFPSSVLPLTGADSHANDRRSTNPFDSDFLPSNTFLDMSSLKSALPNTPMPNMYLDGLTEPWFPQNSVAPFISTSEGGLAYLSGQTPSSQLSDLPSQGPVASVGGNPFA